MNMKKGQKLYVAYGSNLNLEQMAGRCPSAQVYGRGTVNDYKLVFNRVASIEPEPNAKTPVAVWIIDDACEKALDRYEGYPWLYRKEDIEVQMHDGETVKGVVYIMNESRRQLPSMGYYGTIAQGYEDVGLDRTFLTDALTECYQSVK